MEIYKNTIDLYLDNEIWKEIDEYNGDYQVSNLGRIKSLKFNKEKILKQIVIKGYLYVKLCENGKCKNKCVHVLMFENFNNYKIKEDECIHHLNENKLDNNLDNFQLMNQLEHHSLHNKGEKNAMFGKHHSEISKKLISEKQKGRIKSKEELELLKLTALKGEKHPNHKLIEKQVKEIRILGDSKRFSHREIALIYGVHRSTVTDIINRKSWKHSK